MRDLIDIVKLLVEGDVVSLGAHKTEKAMNSYADAIGGILQGEQAFFASGKFSPFAQSYIAHDFDKEYAPELILDVNFRDFRPAPDARQLIAELRKQKFQVTYTKWAKGHEPKENPRQDPLGPFARKVIDLNTAKELFAGREDSPLGAYQPSRSGLRTTHLNNWDDRGIGFNISCGGYDGRRGDKYGNPERQEYHIIDDDKDMKEVSDTYAMIRRAHVKSV
jgi:hypothetical protein